jgi:site-specific recombinase XerD
MKWQNVDFEKNIISVNGRGGIARDVEMQESLLMPLLIFSIKERNDFQYKEDGYLFFASNGKSLNRTTAHRMVKDAAQKTEIVHTISLKTLRNSHGMNLFRQGKSIEYIQKRLGVKNFKALVYECRQQKSFWS